VKIEPEDALDGADVGGFESCSRIVQLVIAKCAYVDLFSFSNHILIVLQCLQSQVPFI
jgi:hypothetical protein